MMSKYNFSRQIAPNESSCQTGIGQDNISINIPWAVWLLHLPPAGPISVGRNLNHFP